MLKKQLTKIVVCLVLLSAWLRWDLTQAERFGGSLYPSFKKASGFDAVTEATTKVAIVRSDDSALPHPIPIDDATIDYPEIEAMVRRAIELAGGFDWIIKSGDMVLLKPNIVDPEPAGSGEVTDVRVIKALIKIVDEIDPGNMNIVVGEGSPREMDYELKFSSRTSPRWNELWDVAGYQELLVDPYLTGIKFRLSNLNGSPPEDPWQDLVEVEVPNGGQADPQGGKYFIHKDVLNADVYITVPVMKIHDPGITVALKNQIGLAPCTMYGFSKTAGVPQDNYKHKLIHQAQAPMQWTEKEIVDLSTLAQIKFSVVDAIACLDVQKTAERSGTQITNLVRRNMIVAGADVVAVDHVCTRLMGMNPDDIEHITLAEKVGLGTNNPDFIKIVGADLDSSTFKFRKNQNYTADYGQSNREWLVKGPFAVSDIADPINHPFIANEAAVHAVTGQDGWSDPIYFIDDRIDLKNYFQLQSTDIVIAYAYCYFDAPKDQEAEFWVGSDEAMKIYVNGEEVYTYDGTRSFSNTKVYTTKVKVNIKAGESTLLVKVFQKYSRFDFSLNICEPETDYRYDGNRIWGLKFKTVSGTTGIDQPDAVIKQPGTFKVENAYPNPFNHSVRLSFDMEQAGQMQVVIFNIKGERVKSLFNQYAVAQDHYLTWDGANESGQVVPSGNYFVRFTDDKAHVVNQKITLMK